MIQETSRMSYADENIKGLSERQNKVFFVVLQLGGQGITDREIARQIGAEDPNFVRPRRFELVKAGILEPGMKRKCNVTGKTSITWKVARKNQEQKEFAI
jgi:hypothetical protein